MSLNLNKAYVGGRLTRKPELKEFEGGKKVCEFSIATNQDWKDKVTGEKKSKPTYHNIKVWGGMIDTCMKYLDKGSEVLVEGRIDRSQSETGNGEKREYTFITAKYVNFAGSKKENSFQNVEGNV